MHAMGTPSVLDLRSGRRRQDTSLAKIVDAARQEFSELSDQEIRALWIRLQTVLLDWAKDRGEMVPQYRTHFLGRSNSLSAYSLNDSSIDDVDFVFLFFLAGTYPPLLKFLRDLAPQPMISLRKAFALMILREAEAKNCPEIWRLRSSFERVLQ
jgi:hypothetical protein